MKEDDLRPVAAASGSLSTTARAARLSSPPTSAVLRTPRPGSRMLPMNAPAVMPTLTAVEAPAAAMSALPGATWSTRLARAVVRAAKDSPDSATSPTAATGVPARA
jgi:hypothetical protein